MGHIYNRYIEPFKMVKSPLANHYMAKTTALPINNKNHKDMIIFIGQTIQL